ncbi:Hypothetical predicted protein [Mytilus galloprovincialis]|uniref:Uncharacterized protein n=1 Tax=Mytilus galloprovincialis TaxID=29158 RepID=A0A8B6GX98_MYTGA|nr:Hypothetical predicted protein [Mytilus galloprovincialis]
MAEIADIIEVIDEAADGMADEAEGAEADMDPADQAEFEEEVADATKEVQELSKTAEVFKDIMEGSLKVLKSFGIFVLKNIAVGAIMYFVNVGLSKLIKAIEKTYDTARHLKTKKDGKRSFNIPTVTDINSLLDGSVSFLTSIRKLRDFAELNKGKVVSLKSFLEIVTPEDLDEIQNQIEHLKKMPLE